MRPWAAWSLIAAVVGATAAALLAPWFVVLGLAVFAAAMMRDRQMIAWFAALSLPVNILLLAWLTAGPGWGPFSEEGARLGAIGAVRLIAVVSVNLAFVQHLDAVRWLESLGLPPRPLAYVAGVLLAVSELRIDLQRILDAQKADGDLPASRIARARVAAGTLVPLLIAAHRRAEDRRDALRSLGIATPPRFAAVVGITALAIVGRMAFAAVPNVSLVYAIVFAGGVLHGWRVGLWAGAWSMLLTDLALTGLTPTAFVNIPSMALVGATGGLFRTAVPAERTWAAAAGILATFLFSIASDTLTWALVPEFRGEFDLWKIRIAAGLAFNALPALTNAVLFAWLVAPARRAWAAFSA